VVSAEKARELVVAFPIFAYQNLITSDSRPGSLSPAALNHATTDPPRLGPSSDVP
jgi:hypothetical protein